ncbi:MAG: radical SAM protein [Bacteroidetes bacterium]|nr:radical SAM protein [Bacteroidota bacterium]
MIQAIQLTNLCCNLIKKDLLRNRLDLAGIHNEKLNQCLFQLYYDGLLPCTEVLSDKNFSKLEALGLIKTVEIKKTEFKAKAEEFKAAYQHFPLAHVEAINLELTYNCNSNCPHCILSNIRSNFKNKELSFEKIKSIIADAYFAGLIENGINFTGGEALLANVDIFELIRYAASYGIPTRLFTNLYWGNKILFKAGDQRFATPLALIKTLKKSGLSQLALSFDSRIYKDMLGEKHVFSVVEACENNGLHYELVSTETTNTQLTAFIDKLKTELSISELKFMTPISMELVDMGGANTEANSAANKIPLKDLILKSLCKTKGFYQPSMLTIAPDGGVRSCMYGVGMNNLGNIHTQSLFEVINSFNDEVSQAFTSHKAFDFIDLLYNPYKSYYKTFTHPCTASVLLARLIQEYLELSGKQTVTADDILKINIKVAGDLNLLAQH